MIQKSMSLRCEPSSELLHSSAKKLFRNRELLARQVVGDSVDAEAFPLYANATMLIADIR